MSFSWKGTTINLKLWNKILPQGLSNINRSMIHYIKSTKALISKIRNLKQKIKNLKDNKELRIKIKMNKPNLNST